VAVKFYSSNAFPPTPENLSLAKGVIRDLAQAVDVVLLDTGLQIDDHASLETGIEGRLHSIERLVEPVHNLDLQTRIIRDSQACFGTYGGFSYLAPLCGIDTVSYYSNPLSFRPEHLELARRVFAGMGRGSFTACEVQDLPLLLAGQSGDSMRRIGDLRRRLGGQPPAQDLSA
jgi:hypothetical protein